MSNKKLNITFFKKDEFIKGKTSLEILSKLNPIFRKNGTVTAGNTSGPNDGAAVMLITSEEAINNYNFRPKARIVALAVVGVEPKIMGIGSVRAYASAWHVGYSYYSSYCK